MRRVTDDHCSLCVLLAVVKITLALPARGTSADQWINRHGPDACHFHGTPHDDPAYVTTPCA